MSINIVCGELAFVELRTLITTKTWVSMMKYKYHHDQRTNYLLLILRKLISVGLLFDLFESWIHRECRPIDMSYPINIFISIPYMSSVIGSIYIYI